MKAPLTFIIILFFSACTKGKEMRRYLSDTKLMVKDGNYKEALDRYVWFHDHVLERDKAMAGVRLSFALNDWKALAEVYPPAMKALIETRDRKTQEVIAGGSYSLFSDVASINRTLEENDKTIQLFETVTISHPEQAKRCWYFQRIFCLKLSGTI
jgi:hypothetical protein